MKDKPFAITTHDHLGDAVILTGAVHNVLQEHPEQTFLYSGSAEQVFQDFPGVSIGRGDEKPAKVTYGTWEDEQTAANGNLVEGFTRSLCRHLCIPMVPLATNIPWIHADPDPAYMGKIVLLANAQNVTRTKFYPHWQKVVDEIRKYAEVVRIGGNEARDISPDLNGVTDMRGKTGDLRKLFGVVAGCAMVLTPPSSLMNIAAGLGRPGVVVLGAREPSRISAYPGMRYVSQPRCGYDGVYSGCFCLKHDQWDRRGCRDYTFCGGSIQASRCMIDLHPARVVAEVRQCLEETLQ